ncbi:reverse transcriptase domain-containing protein [Trichonephila clavipes]|nr:reverse transcriptase domain-containing protein [Trichonephila clavipes]
MEAQRDCAVEPPLLERSVEPINKLKDNKAPGLTLFHMRYRKKKFLAFADDVDIIARTLTTLRQAFLSLEKEALRMGLKINENKTKYMPRTKSCFKNSHFKIEEYNFEAVD